MTDYRKSLAIRVSGFDVPKPIKTFEDCGFPPPIMNAIKKSGSPLPFSVEEYFDEYIEKLKNAVLPDSLGLALYRIFTSIINMVDIEECLIAIGEKLATVENGDITYRVFKVNLDRELLDEYLSNVFETAYNEEKRMLAEKRAELVITLKEISKKKGS